jgi:hypothetical protein
MLFGRFADWDSLEVLAARWVLPLGFTLGERQQAGAPSSSVGGASFFAVQFLPQSYFENGLRLANRADDLKWPLSIPIEGGFLFAPEHF